MFDSVETMLRRVMAAIGASVRLRQAGLPEWAIVDACSAAMMDHGIRHIRERAFGPRCRADLWVPVINGGIVIEVKRDRGGNIEAQLARYAEQAVCRALVVVSERARPLPDMIGIVPVRIIALNALWGIAV